MTTMAPLGKILLYVEPNDKGLEAARYAIALAKNYAARLHAVSVVNVKALQDLLHAHVFLHEESAEIEAQLEEGGESYLALVEKMAREKEVTATTCLLRGVVHVEVVKTAREMGASLLIIGEIKESLSRKDCTFDESECIVCTAGCPVLVVKGRGLVEQFYQSI